MKKAGLVGVLSGKTTYTAFAPTNAAFAKVPKKTSNELSKDKAMLKKVLLVAFSVRGKSAFVNEAKIVKTDVMCSNGIIHALNGVLLPPES